MSNTSRRGFLSLAGIGTAVGVATVVAPTAANAEETEALPKGAEGSMAAYIHDLRAGQVAIMVHGREVIVTDRKLTARMAHAFAKAAKA